MIYGVRKMNEKELKKVIERVSAEVSDEVSVAESNFKVTDLHAQLKEFGNALDSAWTISYSTSSLVRNQLDPGLSSAWEISYSTSSLAAVKNAKIK